MSSLILALSLVSFVYADPNYSDNSDEKKIDKTIKVGIRDNESIEKFEERIKEKRDEIQREVKKEIRDEREKRVMEFRERIRKYRGEIKVKGET